MGLGSRGPPSRDSRCSLGCCCGAGGAARPTAATEEPPSASLKLERLRHDTDAWPAPHKAAARAPPASATSPWPAQRSDVVLAATEKRCATPRSGRCCCWSGGGPTAMRGQAAGGQHTRPEVPRARLRHMSAWRRALISTRAYGDSSVFLLLVVGPDARMRSSTATAAPSSSVKAQGIQRAHYGRQESGAAACHALLHRAHVPTLGVRGLHSGAPAQQRRLSPRKAIHQGCSITRCWSPLLLWAWPAPSRPQR